MSTIPVAVPAPTAGADRAYLPEADATVAGTEDAVVPVSDIACDVSFDEVCDYRFTDVEGRDSPAR